jgi:hypothetical protein
MSTATATIKTMLRASLLGGIQHTHHKANGNAHQIGSTKIPIKAPPHGVDEGQVGVLI